MLFHYIPPSDVRPGDHLYQWQNFRLLQGIAVPSNNNPTEIHVVILNGLNTFHLVTLKQFTGRKLLRRALYNQSDSYLHTIKLRGTSFSERARPAEEIVQNALLLVDKTNQKPGCLHEIIIQNFAQLCCTIEHKQWRDKWLGDEQNLYLLNNFEQASNLTSAAAINEQRVKELEQIIENLKDEQRCQLCMDQLINVAFLCGHVACFECAQKLKTCPSCRIDTHEKIKLFLY
ncbi:unnamed protein product [Adineta steineri]|uniref:RING-type domain-containing protein n=1 Tax=Adineta steineri TaxID=433720 RepID=A0A815BXE1_9BILA|nr:unnamed protein product [Adineta steineri]CAF3540999.1 unnamed protein product [Adineta steineri]